MNTFFEVGSSVVLTVFSPGIEHLARSPFRDGLMTGTHLEGLLAASLVFVFMAVALLKPEWMG